MNMSFKARDVPHIDPSFVTEMTETGFAIARKAIPKHLTEPLKNAAEGLKGVPLDLSREPNIRVRIPIESYIVAMAVHEAFFQAGYTDWKPNLSVLLKNIKQNPHPDNERYAHGVVLVYTSGKLDMQVADSLRGLDTPYVIPDIGEGDVVFLSALKPGDEPSNDVPDGRTWHNAVGDGNWRTMQHMGYEL